MSEDVQDEMMTVSFSSGELPDLFVDETEEGAESEARENQYRSLNSCRFDHCRKSLLASDKPINLSP